jgi:hypothetical protein
LSHDILAVNHSQAGIGSNVVQLPNHQGSFSPGSSFVVCVTRLKATAQTGHWKQSGGSFSPEGRSIQSMAGLLFLHFPQLI